MYMNAVTFCLFQKPKVEKWAKRFVTELIAFVLCELLWADNSFNESWTMVPIYSSLRVVVVMMMN